MLTKIDTNGDRVHIFENGLTAKLLDETVIDATSSISAIFSTIGDQDVDHQAITR